jgi:GNAT superfamily N-acetyltransferase
MNSDQDKEDAQAIHLLARAGGTIQGTVRVNRKDDGKWWGSRLAVIPKFRGLAGKRLVHKAEDIVREQGVAAEVVGTVTNDLKVELGYQGKRAVLFDFSREGITGI